MGNLEGKRILVTGGGSGIGKETALLAAAEGAAVIAGDINEAVLEEVVATAKRRNLDVTGIKLDVTEPTSVDAFVGSFEEPPDGLVCSAGTTLMRGTMKLTLEDWNRILSINLTGTFLCSQATARRMSPAGRGSIVTISSSLAFTGQEGGLHYTASKGGVVSMTKTLALELGRHGIRANCVAPGPIDTPLLRGTIPEDVLAKVIAQHPLGRLGLPEELAESICFLLSDRSSWITGQNLHVNGGYLMS